MTISTIQQENEIVLVVRDGFDAKEADDLHELLLRMGSGQAITVDFRAVRRIEDFVMARLAAELARGPLHVIGLSGHQSRIIRYLSPEDGAEAPRPHTREGDPGHDDS
jgi:anti-anti-sigma regulatory factor